MRRFILEEVGDPDDLRLLLDHFQKTGNLFYTPPMEQYLNFGEALAALQEGKKVARAGWNGKNMYLWYMPAATVKAEWCREPHLKALAEANGGEVECLGTIRMKTADDKVLTGWLASQSDMVATDWRIID